MLSQRPASGGCTLTIPLKAMKASELKTLALKTSEESL
jgi:hypothetical protein